MLNDAGYLDFEPDGRFGLATEVALREWQENHGAKDADGVLRLVDTAVRDWPARVGLVEVELGDFVDAGAELVTLTSQVAAVSFDLVPSDRLRVAEGDPVRVDVSATGEEAVGVLAEVAVDPVDREGSLFYPAVVAVDGELAVPEGTQVRVAIVIERAEDVLAVPVAAVVSDVSGDPAVRVARDDGQVETTPVELGMSEGAWVEVVSGLSSGELVIVAESFTPVEE